MPKAGPPLTIPADVATLAYVAGLFDGEGWVCINRTRHRPGSETWSHSIEAGISNTDERLMVWLCQRLGGTFRVLKPKRLTTWKPTYIWKPGSANAALFLEAVLPYLVLKKERAQLAIECRALIEKGRDFPASRPELVKQRETLKQRVHLMNEKGTSAA